MSPASLAPRAGDATSLGLPRLCLGFAAIHAVSAVLGLFMDVDYRGALIAVDGACAAVFVLIAFLASTRRLPGWRRETAAAIVPILAATAACARAGLIDQYWPAAELILAAAAACVVSARNWFWAVLASCGALWVGCVVTAVARGGFTTDEAARWVNMLLMIGAAAGLAMAVRRARTSAAMALVDAHRQVMEQSVKDPLTGVANRKGLELVARPMIDLARRQGHAVHALVVDVDTLRGINEQHGIKDGDEVLKAVAQGLLNATRATDVVARWAGDEFVMIGPGTGTSPLEMERRIRSYLAEKVKLPREVWQGRVSAGIATLVPWDADDLEGLLERAIQDLSLRRSLKRRAAARMKEEDEELANISSPDVRETAGKPDSEA
ncbi:GGDEF domain-containing protein [Kineosporia succinea]|uniref:Diguanylate cyclase (GGDEF)-like protein n=1 Tax=Kineosporia succinea TaxID=84632 RepID=A0ABT9P5J3_9ACTN|nr:GGDEF domain-containing protein [Kineosporia succinea]MDP9827968.1 diguanylate cyclase (GGDEF)-like protein [Kineosporia succinea]